MTSAALALLAVLLGSGVAQETPPPPASARRVSGSVGVDIPTQERRPPERPGATTQGERSPNARLFSSLRFSPGRQLFVAATFYRYVHQDLQAPWDPDFTYSFGIDDWRPGTFSVVYANYTGNRFERRQSSHGRITRLAEGTVTAGYRLPLSRRVQSWFLVHKSGSLDAQVRYSLTPRYFDVGTHANRTGKHAVSLATRLMAYRNTFIDVTYLYYPRADVQQPWDPDFTYAFGYYDWRPHRVSVFYSNYSGNRYPGRRRSGAGRLGDGSVTLAYGW